MPIRRMQKRGAFVAVSIATLAGCLSFDALTGGQTSSDAATGDASSSTDAPVTDAPIIDAASDLDCAALPDGSLCDDFNRDAAIPFGDLRWLSINCLAADTPTVDGKLTTVAPPTTSSHCTLVSKAIANTGHFMLDFDITFQTTDAAAGGSVILAEVSFTLTKPNEAGIQSTTFQFLLSPAGSAQWQVLNYYPDAAASPTGGMYVPSSLATASPFVEENTSCHIHLVGDDTAMNPSGSGTSTCNGANPVDLIPATNVSGRGLGGVGQLTLGYSDSNSSAEPMWTVDYDNLVYLAQ